MFVSGVQQSESVMPMHESIVFFGGVGFNSTTLKEQRDLVKIE